MFISLAREDSSIVLPVRTVYFDVNVAVTDVRADTIHVTRGGTVTFNVLTNEGGATPDTFTDPNLQVVNLDDPAAASGILVAGANPGEFQFTADANFTGQTSFTYQVQSGFIFVGEQDVAAAPETSTVTIIVDDVPVAMAPVATDTSANGAEDAASISVTVTGTDVDGTIASVTLKTLPANGTLYTDAGLTTLAVIDTVYAGASKTLYFVPTANYNGSTSFTFTVTDDDGTSDATPATATITVGDVNDAPVATDTSANGAEDAASIAVTLTGTDSDGTISSVTVKTLPANGALYTDAGLTTLAVTDTVYAGHTNTL
jgi:hypothetical protein